MIDYRLLGPFEVALDGHVLDVGGLKQRALLAILLLHPNQAVHRDVLIDQLWAERPPAGADHAVGVYIWRLRKTLDQVAGNPCVLTRAGGYLLQVRQEQVDITRFERLADDGQRSLAAGQASRKEHSMRRPTLGRKMSPRTPPRKQRLAAVTRCRCRSASERSPANDR